MKKKDMAEELAGYQAELELQKEELRRRHTMLSRTEAIAHVGSWEWEIQEDRVTWSDELFRIFGLEPGPQAPSFTDHKSIYVPEDRDRLLAAVNQCMTDGTPYELVLRAVRPDGEIRHCIVRGLAEKGDDGRIERLFGSLHDITELRQVKKTLRTRENLLERIFEILPIGLWLADKDGTLLRGNPAGVEIWGAEPRVPPSEYGVFNAWYLPSREPVRQADWALSKTIRNRETIQDELLEIEAFDGKRKTILNYTAPVMDENGDLEGAIVVNLDISKRKTLEAQLIQAQRMESVGRLAGGVAHDFNNMLSIILGQTELALMDLPDTSPVRRRIREIQTSAQRSADLTRQLLAFARRQTVAPRVLDLNQTLEGMLKMLGRLMGEDIDLAWAPGNNLMPVKMDPSQIDQILANLCVNARDAIGHDVGKVTIETGMVSFDQAYCELHAGFVPGDFVMFAVSDNGCGMDRDTLANIFEPFFTTKGMGEGTGLGLSTVYGIVKQNQGFINAYSEPGQGSTFKIYLAVCTEGQAETPNADAGGLVVQGNETILLVEDEPAILKMTRTMLERMGYTVISAATPGEALRLAGNHEGSIHLLLTDVVMPEMNGRNLAKEMSRQYPGIKHLFMSGYTANVIAHHGVLEPGVQFIQKPFSMKDLAEKLKDALGTAPIS